MAAAGGPCTQRAELLCMVTQDPDVVSCLSRICNTILLNDIELLEGNAAVTPALTRIINREYKQFFKDAVVLTYLCGFVPYYIVSLDNTKMPRCLPVGAFTWRVRESPRSTWRRRGVLAYEIRITAGAITEKDVFIFDTASPVAESSVYSMSSPMCGVLEEYLLWKDAERQAIESSRWNTLKHVCVTERIDVKDQTTSGIQLLDEQRRYNLTGQHNNVIHDNLLRLTGAGVTSSVADAYHYAVHSQFCDSEEAIVGSKRAAVHIMPPNTEVQELAPLPCNTLVQDAKSRFQSSVYVFFGLPNINNLQNHDSTVRNLPGMHREQYSNILHMQNTLQRLGERVYAHCFDIDSDQVCFRLRALPRFEIACVDDIKTLFEIQMLTPADIAHLRKTIMNR